MKRTAKRFTALALSLLLLLGVLPAPVRAEEAAETVRADVFQRYEDYYYGVNNDLLLRNTANYAYCAWADDIESRSGAEKAILWATHKLLGKSLDTDAYIEYLTKILAMQERDFTETLSAQAEYTAQANAVQQAVQLGSVSFSAVLNMGLLEKAAKTLKSLSLILGFATGWVVCKVVSLVCYRMDRRKTNRFFRGAQIFGAAAMSFMHGAQDGQKFIGVLFLGIAFSNGQGSVSGISIPVWLMLVCSVVMAAGTSVGGEKIIKSVGMDMVKLEKYQGFSADLAAAFCLLLSSLFGIPVSTTHTKTSAIMGVGAVRRLSAINLGVVKEMMLTWIFTFPGCGLISFLMAKLFIAIF